MAAVLEIPFPQSRAVIVAPPPPGGGRRVWAASGPDVDVTAARAVAPGQSWALQGATVVVAALAVLVALAASMPGFVTWLTGESVATVAAATTPADATYTVQPGDSLWSIAGRLSGDGDVRPVVDRLIAENGGSTVLQPGQLLVLEP